jgi:hypothetical protein
MAETATFPPGFGRNRGLKRLGGGLPDDQLIGENLILRRNSRLGDSAVQGQGGILAHFAQGLADRGEPGVPVIGDFNIIEAHH